MLPPPAPPTALPYQPELMGLRAVTVSLVVLAHWTLADFPVGEVGRLPLFVLSGYLISGIIWKNQDLRRSYLTQCCAVFSTLAHGATRRFNTAQHGVKCSSAIFA